MKQESSISSDNTVVFNWVALVWPHSALPNMYNTSGWEIDFIYSCSITGGWTPSVHLSPNSFCQRQPILIIEEICITIDICSLLCNYFLIFVGVYKMLWIQNELKRNIVLSLSLLYDLVLRLIDRDFRSSSLFNLILLAWWCSITAMTLCEMFVKQRHFLSLLHSLN